MKVISSLLFVLLLTSCSGVYTNKLSFNPTEPLRVAVLPFVTVDQDGKVSSDEGRLVLDAFSLVSTQQKETPPQIVRRQVLTELEKTALDIINPTLIDIDLPHHGFGKSDGTLDVELLRTVSAKKLCSEFLDCDAVLYGEVTKWDRTYLGLQTINTVGINLKLVTARDDKVAWVAQSEDSESRGITKGPTGISSLVLEPIKGLDSDIIVNLARNVVKKTLAPLRLDQRPEFLNSGPPVIFAASHDAPSGILKKNSPLIVVAYASEHQTVTFSIGSEVASVPMFERSPGHYYGEFFPLPGEQFKDQPVEVHVSDLTGRTSSLQIPSQPVSLDGES